MADSEMMKVLIVDDDEAIRVILSDIFKKRGYFVQAAGTGQEALEQVKKGLFHFAVIDIRLPDMKGTELVEQIRKINFKINCILITGYSEEEEEATLKEGATPLLMKPLKMDQLIAIFNRKSA